MRINPYGEEPVRLALALLTDPPATAAELADRCRAAGLTVDMPVHAGDLTELKSFLTDWLTVIDAPDHNTRASRLNVLLAASSAHPRLTDHAGDGWHVHYRDESLPLSAALRALISVGTAQHLSGRGIHRLNRCAATGCTRPFADFSRTGRQRYCSPSCGNRDAVRRHRARTPTH